MTQEKRIDVCNVILAEAKNKNLSQLTETNEDYDIFFLFFLKTEKTKITINKNLRRNRRSPLVLACFVFIQLYLCTRINRMLIAVYTIFTPT